MKSLIIVLALFTGASAHAAESDLAFFNLLKNAGTGVEKYEDPSQSNVIADALMCEVNSSTKAYTCSFDDGTGESEAALHWAQVEFDKAPAQQTYDALVSIGVKPQIFPQGFSVEIRTVTCIQVTDSTDQRSLADRTQCDFIK